MRVAVGVGLAMALGPVGAAVGCVLAGYAGFAVCALGAPSASAGDADGRPPRDLVARHAGGRRCRSWPSPCCSRPTCSSPTACSTPTTPPRFGVLSTIGGAAFFATATIPLVLMPAVRRGRASAAQVAVALTAAVGLGVAAVGAVLAPYYLPRAFGEEYADLARLAGPYLLAMALLGVDPRAARPSRRDRAASGCGRVVAIVAALVAEGVADRAVGAQRRRRRRHHAASRRPGSPIVLELPVRRAPRRHRRRRRRRRVGARASRRWSACASSPPASASRRRRGLWVDEAISVTQAQMPFGQMLAGHARRRTSTRRSTTPCSG